VKNVAVALAVSLVAFGFFSTSLWAQIQFFTLNDIAFVNETTGWVAGQNGVIRRTTDGGLTWTTQESGVTSEFIRLRFLNIDLGWSLSSEDLVATTNGGLTWTPILVQTTGTLRDVFWESEQTGWVVASDSIFRTTDGGISWSGLPNPSISGITFSDSLVGWGFNWESQIYRTDDGGQTWSLKRTNAYEIGWWHHDIFYEAIALSPAKAFFVGTGSNHYDQWAFTTETADSGQTWSEKQFPLTWLNDLDTLSSSIEAFGKSTDQGIIIRSGTSIQNNYPSFVRVSFVNSQLGWCISHISILDTTAWIHQSAIFRTTDGGSTWQRLTDFATSVEIPQGDLVVDNYELHQNYPNPFNPTTTIQVDLPIRSAVKLVVLNILGQAVATLAEAEMQAGRHQISWNAAGLASGVYFARLDAKSQANPFVHFSQTRKLLLAK